MVIAEKLIVKHFDIWTSSIKSKSSSGRGLNKKMDLYGIQKLRELIIQMALVGKLVTQEPEDEHAASSLEKARYKFKEAVSKKLIKKQQLPKESKKTTFKKPLPKGWAYATLPEVVQPVPYSIKRGPFGSSIKKDMFVPDGYKVYEQQHAIYDDFNLGEYYLSENDFNRLKAFEIKPFDVIISCSGTVGRVSIAPEKLKPGVINQALLKISLNQDVLLNEYFKILFPNYFMTLEKLSDLKGTAQKNMPGMPVMKILQFPLPPIAEQYRIVEKVDELMKLCDQLEIVHESNLETHKNLVDKLLSDLTSAPVNSSHLKEAWLNIQSNFDSLFTTERSIDQLKRTIFYLAFMGKLVPQCLEDEHAEVLIKRIKKTLPSKKNANPFLKEIGKVILNESNYDLPSGWAWIPLGNIGIWATGCGFPKKYQGNKGKEFLFCKVSDMNLEGNETKILKTVNTIDSVVLEKIQGKVNLPGTVIFPKIGGAIATHKRRLICQPTLIDNNCSGIQPIGLTDSRWLLMFMQSLDLTKYQSGTSIPAVSQSSLDPIRIGLPPLAEQKRIVRKLDQLISLCDQIKVTISNSASTQMGLADSLLETAIR